LVKSKLRDLDAACKVGYNDIYNGWLLVKSKLTWVRVRLCKLRNKGALDSQPHVIKFTSCLPMVDGSLWVLRLLPPLKLSPWYSWNIAESGIKHQNQIKSIN
jgi:hypothetical protein